VGVEPCLLDFSNFNIFSNLSIFNNLANYVVVCRYVLLCADIFQFGDIFGDSLKALKEIHKVVRYESMVVFLQNEIYFLIIESSGLIHSRISGILSQKGIFDD
jgi:hypothetical protein